MLPGKRYELSIELESDNNLIWRRGATVCRVLITKLQLFIPQVTIEKYIPPKAWSFINEYVVSSGNLRQKQGLFRIRNSILNPRHVFIFILNSSSLNSQMANPFLYQTFNVANNKKLTRCYLKVDNKTDFPKLHYKPSTEASRVFRDVIAFKQNGTLLNRDNFENLFPFIHFKLPDFKEEVDLTFHYILSGETNADYQIFAIVLHEKLYRS